MRSERLEFIKRHGVIIVVVTIRMNCEYQRSSLGQLISTKESDVGQIGDCV